HVTRMILWEEDFNAGLIRLKYSRFCYPYLDRETGKHIPAEVLIITLGYSNYTLAVALPSQKTEDVIEGLAILITRLGGITAAIVPDNMKSAVTKPDRYEPVINEKFLDMANYYGLAV